MERKISTTSQVPSKTDLSLSSSPLPPYEFVWTFPAITPPPPFVLFPPSFLPPPLINTTPFVTIIRAASFLHSITPPPREKPPHALSATVMERF